MIIGYNAAVKEWKAKAARLQQDYRELGEDVANLEPKHGDQTLQKFSTAVGIPYKTVRASKRHRGHAPARYANGHQHES
jgi:hypothetical protein